MNIVLLGPPGAGKGTQASQISDKFDLLHISTGEIFRQYIKENSELGKIAHSYISKGNLVPDDITIKIVKERLSKEDCKNGFILDGFPRTVVQAIALDEFINIDRVIDIDVPLEMLTRRITGRRVCEVCKESFHIDYIDKNETNCPICNGKLIQRADDNEETVVSRLNVYTMQTAPLIDFYKKKGILKTIDGNKSFEEVFNAIVEALENDLH